MDWREEYEPTIDEEKATKKYIKGELMNYYLYLTKYYDLRAEKARLTNRQTGGSVIRMPDGSSNVSDGAQHKNIMLASEVEMRQEQFVDKLDRIDNWMSVLTESQHKVVATYVMKYQCENMHKAALELQYEEDTINKYTKRAIDRIYSRNKKIL